ncbi:MAG: LLM class flavin-dependent oxidoreductase [Limnohabitans sp.]|nr:LLM class flavin-dependent oxidoreductase [Betaproteobacteria bacterium]
MKLSALDQSVAAMGRSQADAIRQTLELGPWCESLGYHRFWVSEHHSHPSIVGSAPEVLLAALAARTSRIRLGSAGVMLPHYSAYKVAEQFRVLDALAPGRLDLGVGRAPGSDGRTAQVLNPDRYASERFPQQVMELQAWVTGQPLPAGHPGHGVWACPSGDTAPTVWMLGSSDYGAQLAAHLGLPYAFAYFITEGQGVEQALELYRDNFRPSAECPKPHAAICVWALAADTEEEAWRLFQSRARWRMDRNVGRLTALYPPDEAVREYTLSEQHALETLRANAFVGTGAQVASKLRALSQRLEVDELALITWTHDPQAQRRSYQLLAQEML